jgi:hypothetical protein
MPFTIHVYQINVADNIILLTQIYPGASHNRFEHSIGVGHLASG